jgi:hypothetical protein
MRGNGLLIHANDWLWRRWVLKSGVGRCKVRYWTENGHSGCCFRYSNWWVGLLWDIGVVISFSRTEPETAAYGLGCEVVPHGYVCKDGSSLLFIYFDSGEAELSCF